MRRFGQDDLVNGEIDHDGEIWVWQGNHVESGEDDERIDILVLDFLFPAIKAPLNSEGQVFGLLLCRLAFRPELLDGKEEKSREGKGREGKGGSKVISMTKSNGDK